VTNPVYSAPLDLVTTAVLELLRTTGRTVYDGAYGGDPIKPIYPYSILYRIPGGSTDPFPDLDGNPREATVAYQVTTVSNLRNQCEATARLLHDRLLARTGSGYVYGLNMPTGWTDIDRRPDPAMPGIDRGGEPPAAIYSLPQRIYLTIAPT
jgi:hypothetical protein